MEISKQHSNLLKRVSSASVAVAFVLLMIKLFGWLYTGSVSILASFVDSLMDIVASLINLFAIRYSLIPPDEEHKFGHGKIEALAGVAQAAFISGSSIFLILQAINRFYNPQPIQNIPLGLVISVISILFTFFLLVFQYYVIRKTNSVAIKADALHYLTDLFANAAMFVALFLVSYGFEIVDLIFAIGIALYILYSAKNIGMDAIDILMDKELPVEHQKTIYDVSMEHDQVKGVHDLRTRQSGLTYFIQLHIELEDHLPLIEAHQIADEVEANIQTRFPNADIIIHQDPIGLMD